MGFDLESLLVEYCSPTLASIKAANLFSASYSLQEEVESEIERVNAKMQKKGIRLTILSFSKQRVLIYVYRVGALARILGDNNVKDFLFSYGYCTSDIDSSLDMLKSRFSECRCFPHEIGIFLGYPLVDVKGFIDEKGANYKFAGIWKVYGSENEAEKYFERIKRCISTYKHLFSNGVSIDKLTVKAV